MVPQHPEQANYQFWQGELKVGFSCEDHKKSQPSSSSQGSLTIFLWVRSDPATQQSASLCPSSEHYMETMPRICPNPIFLLQLPMLLLQFFFFLLQCNASQEVLHFYVANSHCFKTKPHKINAEHHSCNSGHDSHIRPLWPMPKHPEALVWSQAGLLVIIVGPLATQVNQKKERGGDHSLLIPVHCHHPLSLLQERKNKLVVMVDGWLRAWSKQPSLSVVGWS